MAYGSTSNMKSPPKKPANKPAKKPVKKPVKKALTPAQEKKLKAHSVHHTKKHIDMMRKDMMAGMPFSKAHTKASRMQLV